MREEEDAIKICSDHFKLLLFMFKFSYFLCLGHCVKYLASFRRRFPDGQQTMIIILTVNAPMPRVSKFRKFRRTLLVDKPAPYLRSVSFILSKQLFYLIFPFHRSRLYSSL